MGLGEDSRVHGNSAMGECSGSVVPSLLLSAHFERLNGLPYAGFLPFSHSCLISEFQYILDYLAALFLTILHRTLKARNVYVLIFFPLNNLQLRLLVPR